MTAPQAAHGRCHLLTHRQAAVRGLSDFAYTFDANYPGPGDGSTGMALARHDFGSIQTERLDLYQHPAWPRFWLRPILIAQGIDLTRFMNHVSFH